MYIDLVILLNFLVDFFLLLGANRLCGYPPGWGRAAIAAGVGGLFGGACLLPFFSFLARPLWLVVILCTISWIAFGFSRSGIRRGVVFVLLSMALSGIAYCFGNGGYLSVVAAALVVALMCGVGLRGRIGEKSYVPVEVSYKDRCLHLTALQDTGNNLRDPVTGRSVLIISGDAAEKLTGLTKLQLQTPLQSITDAGIPGLRLIPYKTVGQPCGMLLGLHLKNVKIGRWTGNSLVAFAPESLSNEGGYQALTGGML